MYKVILMMLLAVVSSSAMAEWVEVDTSDDSTYYANPNTIRKSGNKVKESNVPTWSEEERNPAWLYEESGKEPQDFQQEYEEFIDEQENKV